MEADITQGSGIHHCQFLSKNFLGSFHAKEKGRNSHFCSKSLCSLGQDVRSQVPFLLSGRTSVPLGQGGGGRRSRVSEPPCWLPRILIPGKLPVNSRPGVLLRKPKSFWQLPRRLLRSCKHKQAYNSCFPCFI